MRAADAAIYPTDEYFGKFPKFDATLLIMIGELDQARSPSR